MRTTHSMPGTRSAGWPAVASAAALVAVAAWAPHADAQQGVVRDAVEAAERDQKAAERDQKAATVDDKGGSFSIQPETMAFGRTPLFFKRTDSFVVRNHGQAALRNLKVELQGGNEKLFSLDNGCGTSLAPGQQCEVKVSFEPTSAGDKSAELRLTAGDNAVRSRTVTGAGVAAKYTATPKSVAFGKVGNGTSSKEQVVTITNTGDVAIPITATSVSGENERQFAQSNDCPRELAPGKSCRSTVLFRPTWEGDHKATLTVWAKGGAPETQIALTGTGTAERNAAKQPSNR